MANTKKTSTPQKSGARCCSSKKSNGVNACGTRNKTNSKTTSKKSETVK